MNPMPCRCPPFCARQGASDDVYLKYMRSEQRSMAQNGGQPFGRFAQSRMAALLVARVHPVHHAPRALPCAIGQTAAGHGIHQRLPRALEQCDVFRLETRRLAAGDYLLDGSLLIERKTLPDFVSSIEDGRIFSQALRLAEANLPAALILEGRGRDLSGCRMRWEAIQGALVTVALFIGIPVLRSRSPADTVRTLLYTARQRPKNKRALQNHILQGFPGIGPERARRLLDHFGSVGAVVAAPSDSLQAVVGIGPRTAGRLVWSVEEPQTAYYGLSPCI
jgi:DNA excision repair protein ERCC-4